MSHYNVVRPSLGFWLGLLVFGAQLSTSFAQLSPVVAKSGYADTVFVNGNIVSMDDVSNSNDVGNVYQAVAVKGHRIMQLGTTNDMKPLIGPITKVLDLKGRTLIPGIIEPHTHLYGGVTRYLDRLGFKYPPDGVYVASTDAERTLEETQANIRDALKEAVEEANPGDWVVLNVRSHPDAPTELRVWSWTRRLTDKQTIDLWGGDENPVLLRPSTRGWINSKALEALNEFMPGYSESIQETMHGVDIGQDIPTIGWVGSQEMSVITWELFLEQLPPATLAQGLKILSEEFAALGVTTFASRIQFPKIMSGYSALVSLGQMPIRFSAHYEVHRMPTDPQQTRQIYRRTGVLQGLGDDYFWIDGVASERWDSNYPESCTGPDVPAPAHIKSREVCPKPGDLPWDVLENAMKSGWRLAGVHICGSESARAFMRMIDRAREVNGWTIQQVHDMHMTGEHCDVIGQQPDILEGLKKYGIILSCGADYIRYAPDFIADYGPKIEPFILPFKTYIESGVKLVGQHYGGGALRKGGEGSIGRGFQPPFYQHWQLVTRRYDGKVWQPEERIERVHAMKMFTSWAAEYVTKPDKLGTLEVGKLADMAVLDRDYFTIPVDDILKIRPLMTMVGGKIIVLQQVLAADFEIDSVGPSYSFEDHEVEHIGKPFRQ
ncbi:MAG: amidohydrolase family protein [Acidobacteriota bacterium]|nr:amidohydrolase family protein [Acidobacteriota bacterium]